MYIVYTYTTYISVKWHMKQLSTESPTNLERTARVNCEGVNIYYYFTENEKNVFRSSTEHGRQMH